MTTASPENEARDNWRQIGPNAVRSNQQLRLKGERGRIVAEAASQAIPRRRAIVRGVAMLGHCSCASDQPPQTVALDESFAANFEGIE